MEKTILKILVISGMHGDETHAVQLCNQLKNTLRDYNGLEFEFFEAVNKTGLKVHQREWADIDDKSSKDLNRSFGTTYQTLEDTTKDLKEKIEKADVVLDVHNSPYVKNCILVSNNEKAKNYIEFAKKYGIEYSLRETPGKTVKDFCVQSDKVAFTVEINGMDFAFSEEEEEKNLAFLTAIIYGIHQEFNWDLNNFFPKFLKPQEPYGPFQCLTELRTHTEGLFKFAGTSLKLSKIFKKYKEGEEIVGIYDIKGNCLETIKAPCEGTLICVNSSYSSPKFDYFGDFQPKL